MGLWLAELGTMDVAAEVWREKMDRMVREHMLEEIVSSSSNCSGV
jgi:hypothetical protein